MTKSDITYLLFCILGAIFTMVDGTAFSVIVYILGVSVLYMLSEITSKVSKR